MFKNQSSFIDDQNINQEVLAKEKNLVLENIPVHTMAKDIQEINNPSLKINFYPEKSEVTSKTDKLNEKQKSSPFLKSSVDKTHHPSEPAARLKTKNDYSAVNKAIQPKPIILSESNQSSSTKFFILLIFIIIILTGVGAYYFVLTRNESPINIQSEEAPKAKTSEQIPAEISQPKTDLKKTPLTTEKPNYITLDIATTDPNSLKELLKRTAQEVSESKLTIPLEFILVDKQNKQISFQDFSSLIGIGLPAPMLYSLEKNFSLFFFNDSGNEGLGLKLSSSDSNKLKSQLSQEESNLAKELSPVFLYENPTTPKDSTFNSTIYKKTAVRYQNLISPQKLSIDYAFYEKNLIIATTKNTLESILNLTLPN